MGVSVTGFPPSEACVGGRTQGAGEQVELVVIVESASAFFDWLRALPTREKNANAAMTASETQTAVPAVPKARIRHPDCYTAQTLIPPSLVDYLRLWQSFPHTPDLRRS